MLSDITDPLRPLTPAAIFVSINGPAQLDEGTPPTDNALLPAPGSNEGNSNYNADNPIVPHSADLFDHLQHYQS